MARTIDVSEVRVARCRRRVGGDTMARCRFHFVSGKGGVTFTISEVEMSQILSDSGVEEAGDVPHLTVRPTSWQPVRTMASVCLLKVNDVYVFDGDQDGPEAVIRLDLDEPAWRSTTWFLRVGPETWVELCRAVAKEIGHPWLAEYQAMGLPPVRS